MKTGYCIPCEKNTIYHTGDFTGDFHIYLDGKGEPVECDGPFATSEPPILPENWIDLVTEPSAEELEQMDANAEELLAEVMA